MSISQSSRKIAVVASSAALMFASSATKAFDISFTQLDWLNESGGYVALNSEWGQANLTFTSADAGLFFPTLDGGFEGFVSISTQLSGSAANWAVQNLAMAFGNEFELNGRLAESVTFDLGLQRGTDINSLGIMPIEFGVSVTATPTPTAPLISSDPIGVDHLDVLFGGENGGGSGQVAPEEAQNFVGATDGEKTALVGKISGDEKEVPAVAEEINGCAPGAVARSLKYLELHNPRLDHVPGTVQEIYDILKDADHMMTGLGEDGGGTATPKIKSGKDTFVRDNKLRIATEQTTDVEKAKKVLNAKGDVEIGIRFRDEDGNTYGHRAFVSEIIDLTDALGNSTGFQVKYLDDKQGDSVAENLSHWVAFNDNGTGRSANVKELINFQVETVPDDSQMLLLLGIGLGALAFFRRQTI